MRCRRHPSAECLNGKLFCFLCGDWRGSYAIESDRNKFERERLAQHIQPGVRGVSTRGQYQRLLKRHGMTDDVTTKELMCLTRDTNKRARVQEEKIRAYLTRLTPQLQARSTRLFTP